MEFRIEKAEAAHAEEIAGLIRTVWEAMENREWFVPDDTRFIREVLTSGRGFIFRAIDPESGRTAGIMDILTPGLEKENLGYDAGFSKEQLLKTAHVDSVAILPEYRGRHLQAKLMEAAEKELSLAGYRYLMCTVHPDNRFSRGNMLGQGYKAVCRKEKYGGCIRDIMMKEIT